MRLIFSFIIWGAVMLAGTYVTWKGACSVWEGYVSSGWSKTVGTVEQSRIDRSSEPIISYGYSVEGHPYSGSRYDTSWFKLLASSRQIVSSLPLGSQQTVYFSPSYPQDSLLLTGIRPASFQGIVIGTLILSVGFFFCTITYLAPKYGEISPSGRSYNFDNDSPVVPIVAVGFAAIASQCILIWFLVR